VIPKQAITRFLNAPRDDHRSLKKLTHKELDRKLAKFGWRPHPKNPPLGLHQKVGLYLGIRFGSLAFFYDMGTGKSLLSLELLQFFWDNEGLRRAIVFVTSDKAFPTWEKQLRQYHITVPYCTLDAPSSEEKWRILRHFGEGIIFMHYPGATAMVAQGKGALSDSKVNKLARDVDAVVWDESTRVGNYKSLAFRLGRRLSKRARFRFALAGRPFGRDPTPLWSQMYLIDHGESLGETLELFRAAFFSEKQSPWSKSPYAKDYKFLRHLEPELSRITQHSSLTYTADECIDLPPVIPIIEPVKLPTTTKAYYKELIEEAIAAKGNKRVMKNVFLRMRQLSSGFLGLRDDETGEKAEIEFAENPKLELLLDHLDVLPRNRKALIFYQYTVSGRRIAKEIKEQFKVEPVWLWSGTKNPREQLRRFMEDDDAPFVVVNNQVGAYSLDGLQVANYEFFFESPVSVIDREQAERRIVRQGQRHRKCFLYDLIVQDTVDEKILEFHKEGKDLFAALLANPGKVLV